MTTIISPATPVTRADSFSSCTSDGRELFSVTAGVQGGAASGRLAASRVVRCAAMAPEEEREAVISAGGSYPKANEPDALREAV